MTRLKWTKWTTVYHLHDEDDNLLYVGVTHNLDSRVQQHRFSQKYFWFEEVAQVTCVGVFEDRLEALAKEKKDIEELHPKYNVQHNGSSRWTEEDHEKARQVLRGPNGRDFTLTLKRLWRDRDTDFIGVEEDFQVWGQWLTEADERNGRMHTFFHLLARSGSTHCELDIWEGTAHTLWQPEVAMQYLKLIGAKLWDARYGHLIYKDDLL